MTNPFLTHLRCTVCQRTYTIDEVLYTCPACGEVGTLDTHYNFDAMRSAVSQAAISASTDQTMWRYRALTPIGVDEPIPFLPVGGTPLIPVPRLAEAIGVRDLLIKDDGRNPTGSLKDRASAMVVARAMAINAPVITTASTGNAAAALAGVAASVGIRTVIFVPVSAPEAKIAQLLVYGATVFLVEGSYDDAFDLCMQAAQTYGWYCRNTGINPFTTEGKKTVSFEIAEALGWKAPDVVVVSVGDGSIISGVYKGFADLHALGWIDHIPRLIGVQAAGSASLYEAWRRGSDGTDMTPINASTIADSIASDLPRDRVKALRAVRETDGAFVRVTDDQIIAAIPDMARLTGIFAEPASAAALAGLRQSLHEGVLDVAERVVLLSTGNGLKDIRGAMRSVGSGYQIRNSIEDVRRLTAELRLG